MYKNYFKIAIRQLLKHKLFSALNIFGLAISIAVCLLLIMILYDQYSFDSFHQNKDHIYRIISSEGEKTNSIRKADRATTSLRLAQDLKNDCSFVKQATRLVETEGDFFKDNNIIAGSKQGYFVDPDFVEMFDFGWIEGNELQALKNPRSIVLTEEFAAKHLGGEEQIGKLIDFKNLGEFQITGILPASPIRSHIRYDFLISYSTVDVLSKEEKRSLNIYNDLDTWRGLVYVLLNDRENLASLENTLLGFSKDYSLQSSTQQYWFEPQPFNDIAPSRDLSNEIGVVTPHIILNFLIVLGLIIMLAACFNYMNLSIARSLKRAKEIGIRKVIGANKKDIIIQFLGEAIIISTLSFFIAIALLEILIPAFYELDPFIEKAFYLSRTAELYIIFLGFSIVVGLLAGIFPAFNISKFQPIKSIQQLSHIKLFSRVGLRKLLLTVQFAFSLIFILTVIVIVQQQDKVLGQDIGVDVDNLLSIRLNDDVDYQKIKNQIEKVEGVVSICGSTNPIIVGRSNTIAKFQNQSDSLELFYNMVSSDYMDKMDITLLEGEQFPKNTTFEQEQVIIINEEASKRMGHTSPAEALGEIIWVDNNPLKVIGVTENFHHDNIWFSQIAPFGLRLGNDFPLVNVRINEKNTAQTVEGITQLWNQLSPKQPIDLLFVDEKVYDLSKFFRVGTRIIGFIGFLTILISCLGLLGMVIYTVEDQLKDISIRKILGASETNLNWYLSKGFLKLLSIAIIIAVPVTIFFSNLWLQNFVTRINIDFWMIILGVSIILLLAFITIFSQTFSASRTNPVNALRNE